MMDITLSLALLALGTIVVFRSARGFGGASGGQGTTLDRRAVPVRRAPAPRIRERPAVPMSQDERDLLARWNHGDR